MTRSERDLVTALRNELAAIDPARPCDRVAEAAGLGTRLVTREPAIARLAVRLRRAGEGSQAAPFDWATAAEHCRTAWLRAVQKAAPQRQAAANGALTHKARRL